MNARQARFVQEYLIDRNASGAAVRAGYSEKTAGQIGHALLKKAEIAEAVHEGELEVAADARITRQKVLDGLQEAIALARARSDASAMIAGWREVAKLCGYHAAERHHVHVSADTLAIQHEFEQLTDAELLAIVAKAPPEVRRISH